MTLKDSDILNLPEAPGFISEVPRFTMQEMMEICEKMLPYWNEIRYSRPEPKFKGEEFSLAEPLHQANSIRGCLKLGN